MINYPPFLPERGLNAAAYRWKISPFKKFLADLRVTDTWKIVSTAISAKEVIAPDVSFWQDDDQTPRKIDFAQMKVAGAQGVIIRGGQGNYIDEDFVDYWRAAKKDAGLPRGAYWFYDPRVAPQMQADLFASLFTADPPELGLTLDAEYPTSWGGAYAGWQKLYDFMERLKVKLPKPQKEIYTGYYWWYDNVWTKCTTAQLAYFKQYPLHLAWYINDVSYVKIPLPWTQADFRWWQYTDNGNGPLYGVESSNIDLNYFVQGGPDEFRKTFALGTPTAPPPVEVVSTPYSGMTLKQGLVNGWDYCLFKIDPRKFRFEVVALNPPETISSVVKRKGAIAGWNTGDYNRFTYAIQDYLVSNGKEIVARDRLAARPSLMFNSEGLPIFDTKNAANVQQAFTGIRPLVELGTISTKLFDTTQAQNTEGHARFAFGLDATGNVMLFSSRGIHPSLTVFDGLLLKETAQVLQENGAQSAADGGGGGDMTVVLNGQSLIVPENEENGVHFERPLPAALLLYEKETAVMATTLKGISNIDGLNLKDGSLVVYKLAKGQVVYGNYSATKTDLIDIRRVYAADGTTLVTSFANPVKASAAYLTIMAGQDPAEIVPPPSTEPDSIEVKVTENGVVNTYKIVGEITVS